MKRILLTAVLFLFGFQSVFAEVISNSDEILAKLKSNRAEIYSQLGLSRVQTKAINKIDARVYRELTPKLEEIAVFIKKLEEIANSEDCTMKRVNEVKKEFKSVNKEISKLGKSYEKEFKNVLTPEQKSVYKVVKKEQGIRIRQEIQELKESQKNNNI